MQYPQTPPSVHRIRLLSLLAGAAWLGVGLPPMTRATPTNFYPVNRSFQPVVAPVQSPLSPAALYSGAQRLTGIVGPVPLITNRAELILQSGLTWMQESPASAWGGVTGPALTTTIISNQIPLETGFLAGLRTHENRWGAFHWSRSALLDFQVPTQTVWISPQGVSNPVVRVLVGSIGDFLPGETGRYCSPLLPPLDPTALFTTQIVWRLDDQAYLRLAESRWISPHLQDADLDDVPDFADGYNADGIPGNRDDQSNGDLFPAWQILLPPIEDPATFLIRVTYAESDPLAVVPPGSGTGWRPAPGTLRLWLDSAQALRDGLALEWGGDFLPPGVYTAQELGLTPDSISWTLYLEMIRSGAADEIQIDWSTDGGTLWRPMEHLSLRNVIVDLDVDSDNTDGYALPGRTDVEDAIEFVDNYRYLPGKIIGVARGDADGDHIPDFADGFDADPADPRDDLSTHRFVPLAAEIALPTDSLSTGATVTFEYFGPATPDVAITITQANWSCRERRLYALTNEAPLRLWRRDGNVARDARDAAQGGDFVVPAQAYPLALFTSNGGGFTLFVEALQPSLQPGDRAIRMVVDPDGTGVNRFDDEVRLSAIALDLQAYNANTLRLPLEDPAHEQWEDDQPFFFWVNDGWDNPFIITRDAADPWITGDNDLLDIAPLALRYAAPFPSADWPATWKIRWRLLPDDALPLAGGLRLFENRIAATPAQTNCESFECPYAYLRLETAAQAQLSASAVALLRDAGPTEFLHRPAIDPAQDPRLYYTFEGTAPGRFRLALELVDTADQRIIAADHALFEFPAAPGGEDDPQSVAGHFGEWNLRAQGDSDFLPMADTSPAAPESAWWRRNPADPALPEEFRQRQVGQAIFFVHGFNESADEARQSKNRPTYKRLYWAGIPVHRYQNAQFIALQWPGDLGRFNLFDALKYNFDIFNAFYAGNRFGELLDRKLNEPGLLQTAVVHVVAHSLGNAVAGQAIQSLGAQRAYRISTYSLLEAAVTASAFDTASNSIPAHPDLIAYALVTGYSTNLAERDAIWTNRWQNAGVFFNFLNPDAWNIVPIDYTLPVTPYSPWSTPEWQNRWTYEARHFVAYRTNELASVEAADAYARRWTHPAWGADADPWRGRFDQVSCSVQMHNFTTKVDHGPDVSNVLRMDPPYLNLYFASVPGPWRLCQAQLRPEDATDPLFCWISQDSDDPDQSDPWDEDLPQQPWHPALPSAMTNGWTEAQIGECRRYAELAHYFVEMTPPAGVAVVVDPCENHEITDLKDVMDSDHSYFVQNPKYWRVYPLVWKVMQTYMKPVIQEKGKP